MDHFLESVTLPVLKETQKEELETPITHKEFQTPGGHGFTNEFYKCFLDVLSPLLVKLYNDIIDNQEMPYTMCTAIISLLPKPAKDHQLMSDYPPEQ
uniref:Uncharacterized protein n=1 Tax=Seriola dumerili TaxID=41447 RepID=A0A3B4VCI3_SERDU